MNWMECNNQSDCFQSLVSSCFNDDGSLKIKTLSIENCFRGFAWRKIGSSLRQLFELVRISCFLALSESLCRNSHLCTLQQLVVLMFSCPLDIASNLDSWELTRSWALNCAAELLNDASDLWGLAMEHHKGCMCMAVVVVLLEATWKSHCHALCAQCFLLVHCLSAVGGVVSGWVRDINGRWGQTKISKSLAHSPPKPKQNTDNKRKNQTKRIAKAQDRSLPDATSRRNWTADLRCVKASS